jgi:hypothetical protein
MRDNSKRVRPNLEDDGSMNLAAAQMQVASATQEQTQEINQIFNFSTPTDFVRIPSGGKYYPPGHPLHQQEFVEIRFMTAKDEDIITSKALLKQGVAIDRLLENVIIDKRIKVQDLLAGDKSALLVGVRTTGFGPEYKTKITCPSCGALNSHEFDLSDMPPKPEPDYEALSVETTQDGTFLYTLPKTGAVVELKLLTSRDESTLVETLQRREKKGLPLSTSTTQLASIIVSVNNVTNRGQIMQFIDHMPAFDSRKIKEVYAKLVPNLDMTQEFRCDSCNAEQEVEIPITVDFFWSRQ